MNFLDNKYCLYEFGTFSFGDTIKIEDEAFTSKPCFVIYYDENIRGNYIYLSISEESLHISSVRFSSFYEISNSKKNIKITRPRLMLSERVKEK